MFELEEQHRILEQMIRAFCEKEIAPHVEAMEKGEVLPFDLMRDLAKKFGIDRFRSQFEKSLEKKKKGGKDEKNEEGEGGGGGLLGATADPMLAAIVGKELSPRLQ